MQLDQQGTATPRTGRPRKGHVYWHRDHWVIRIRLANGKRVIIALARGGFYNEGSPAAALEHLESYLRGVFNFIGIEPEFVAADGLAIGPEQRETAIGLAIGETVRLAA